MIVLSRIATILPSARRLVRENSILRGAIDG
jgi:hypothetical protein